MNNKFFEKVITRTLFVMMIFKFTLGSPKEKHYTYNEIIEHKEKYLIKKKKEKETRVTVTVYNPVREQCDSNPLITADGQKINLRKLNNGSLKWVAVSRDLLKTYKFGDKIRIRSEKYPEINGIYEVHDVMHKRHTLRIDILQPKVNGLYGKWNDVIVSRV